jgi:hypothetical protein
VIQKLLAVNRKKCRKIFRTKNLRFLWKNWAQLGNILLAGHIMQSWAASKPLNFVKDQKGTFFYQ